MRTPDYTNPIYFAEALKKYRNLKTRIPKGCQTDTISSPIGAIKCKLGETNLPFYACTHDTNPHNSGNAGLRCNFLTKSRKTEPLVLHKSRVWRYIPPTPCLFWHPHVHHETYKTGPPRVSPQSSLASQLVQENIPPTK